MSELESLAAVLSLSMGAAWASGINLYAAVLVLGLGGATGNIDLPENLQLLQDPMVLLAAGLMYGVEFFADKIPGVDTGWDAMQTFVRIPAGAMLAAGGVGEVGPAMELAAALMGGGVAAATHSAKAGTRVLINTSPEPVTNWTASITEDIAVVAGLWAALNHPVLFMIALVLFLLFLVWALPKLWTGIKAVARKIGSWLGLVKSGDSGVTALAGQLEQLEQLRRSGALTDAEFAVAKKRLLGDGEPAAVGAKTQASEQ